MKRKILSALLAISLIILTAVTTAAQPMYNNIYGGEALTQHPEDETPELPATPGTTNGDASGETPAPDPDPDLNEDPEAPVPATLDISTFALGGDGNIADIASDNHTLVLSNGGVLKGFGHNLYGQLGLGAGAPEIVYEPTEITFFKNNGLTPVAIAVCNDASFVLCSNSELYATGRGTNGRTGLSHTNNVNTWTLVPGSQALRFSKIYTGTGREFVIAETDNNELYAWGKNSKGQLGKGDKIDASSPVKIMSNANVKELHLGEDFVTLWHNDDSYSVWGNNDGSRYGFDTGTIAPSSTALSMSSCNAPNQNCSHYVDGITKVPCTHTFGTCTGKWSTYAAYGGIKGNNQVINLKEFTSPQKVVSGTGKVFSNISTLAQAWNPTGTADGVTSNINKFKSTAVQTHTHNKSSCTAYYCMGEGRAPLTANGTATGTATWQYVLPNAYAYFDTGHIIDLQLGNKHGIVNINGTWYGWGDNSLKQQGTSGSANGYMVPLTQINDFIRDLDNSDGFNHLKVAGDTVFITSSNGKIFAFGANPSGKAGVGSASYIDTPTQITALAGKSIADIVSGRNTTLYIAHDGSVSVSGDNSLGQSGLGEAYKDSSKITTPSIIEDLKFSATELPPDAPDSLDTPNEVETEQQINIQWSTVSNASAYILTRKHTSVQSTFGIMTMGEEETEVVYIGSDNNITDIAPSEAGEMYYSVKAINPYGDQSPATRSSGINVLDNGGTGGNNNGGGDTNNGNNNNNGGGGVTNNISLHYDMDEDFVKAINSAIRRMNSGEVNVTVPGIDDKTLAFLASLFANQGDGSGQAVPGTNVYNPGMSGQELAELIRYLGVNEMGPVAENPVDIVGRMIDLKTLEFLSSLGTQPAAATPVYYQPQSTGSFTPKNVSLFVIIIMILAAVALIVVRIIPVNKEEG